MTVFKDRSLNSHSYLSTRQEQDFKMIILVHQIYYLFNSQIQILENYKREVTDLKAEIKTYKDNQNQIEEQNVQLQGEIEDQKMKLTKLNTDIKGYQETANATEKICRQMTEEKLRYKSTAEAKNAECQKLQSELARNQLIVDENAKLKGDIEEYKKRVINLEAEIKTYQEKIDEMTASLQLNDQAIRVLQTEKDKLVKDNDDYKLEITSLETELQTCRDTICELRQEKQNNDDKIKELEKQRADIFKAYTDLQRQIDTAKKTLNRSSSIMPQRSSSSKKL